MKGLTTFLFVGLGMVVLDSMCRADRTATVYRDLMSRLRSPR